ncbi:helix-turn-helix domain-containing protein [Jannaschia formosa]|uniref:helix-turn-helix domain-containing protein n=1 Tax=Jannaschia formosa TaxID=2259592 RepID=UPI001431BA0F|nr:helix-turn-helix domain-containing protein [Jannaschia formosa]
MSLIEQHAVFERMPLSKAAKIMIADRDNFDLMLAACGKWWRGGIPAAHVYRRWYDREKMALAKRHPHLTPEEHALAAPYLPVSKRPKDHIQLRRKKRAAENLLANGLDRKQTAERLGVSLATVYRWIPAKCP